MRAAISNVSIPFARRDARNGIVWIRRAYAMFRAAPLRWLLLLFSYYLLIGLLELGPVQAVGQFVAPLLKPVFAVGFLAAAWSQERGIAPRFEHLFRGFRSNLLALVPLGAAFLVGITLALIATALVDDGRLMALISGAEKPTEEALASGPVQLAMLFGAVCAVPSLLALWFAPALVVFNDAGAVRALGTSLRAAIANWRPIGVYCLAVIVLGLVLPILAISIARLFGDAVAGLVALFVVVPYLFTFVAALHISDYVSYRDVFHADEAPPGTSSDSLH
ncbi:MAG TPA: BPSS1780 family membrane protein [Casimicrobiaceae bacterium]|nr:BPSS1780 family membrane protein [Casimicrobiaceae bacterium]